MCGIIGVYGIKKAIHTAVAAAIRLQHRGHDSAGAVAYGNNPREVKKDGRIGEIFTKDRVRRLGGKTVLVQNKYATTGNADDKANRQPFTRRFVLNGSVEYISLSHNGNFTNPFYGMMESTSDTELVLKGFENTNPSDSIEERIFKTLSVLDGAFSLLFIHRNKQGKDSLIAVRDPYGFRPLCYGKYDGGYIFASESVALAGIGAEFERFVEPGEIIVVDDAGLRSYKPKMWQNYSRAFCIFEYIYFAHPCSRVETDNGEEKYVWQIRHELGKALAASYSNLEKEIDSLCPVPNSATMHAYGISNAVGMPIVSGIIRNAGAGRTFIAPMKMVKVAEGRMQELMLHILRKFSFPPGALFERRVGLVDDSIVRGNTMQCIVEFLKKYNRNSIKSLIALIASAPITHPCFYGIRINTKRELAINQAGGNPSELAKQLGLDKVVYLLKDKQSKVVAECTGRCADSFCAACFCGEYPTSLEDIREDYRRALEE